MRKCPLSLLLLLFFTQALMAQSPALTWQKCLGGGYEDDGQYIEPTSDGGYIMTGNTQGGGGITGNRAARDMWYTTSTDLPGYHPDLSSTVGDFYAAKLSPPVPPPTVTINTPTDVLCAGTPFTFTASVTNPPANIVYQWISNGVNQGDNNPAYTDANPANGDRVFCRIIVADGSITPVSSNTVTLAVSPLPAPAISISGAGGPVCDGTLVTFTAAVTNGGGAPVYQWQVNGGPVGSGGPIYNSNTLANGDLISCVYSDNTACAAPVPNVSNTLTAQVLPVVQPGISITASTIAVCDGSPVNFTTKIQNGGAAPAYQWKVDGQPAGTGDPDYSSSTLQDGDVVSCVLTSNAACADPADAVSNPVLISVDPVEVSGVSIGYSPATVCSGQPVAFTATPTGEGPKPAYQWSVNGSPAGTNSTTFTSSTLAAGDVVSCELSDPVGCITSSMGSVTPVVNPTPVVGTAPVILLTRGLSVTLELPVTGDVASYSWTPGLALSDPSLPSPVATPLVTTTYTLTVVSPAGCADSGHLTVKVFSALKIPGAFSPNGDGHNDIFYVIGGPIGSVVKDFAVFDRWGQRVFQVHDVAPDDPAFGWDGRIRGQAAPTGAYIYELQMGFADGTSQVYKGTVILVR